MLFKGIEKISTVKTSKQYQLPMDCWNPVMSEKRKYVCNLPLAKYFLFKEDGRNCMYKKHHGGPLK